MSQYFGKYRGKVTNNLDPNNLGRIQVSVPAVFGDFTLNWAMPCVPYAGAQNGFYAIPPVDSNVWVEFEAGDPERPIWTGCFWGLGEVPTKALATPAAIDHVVLQTPGPTLLLLSDMPGPTGGIVLSISTGAKITVNDLGIAIDNGKGAKIELKGPTVSINGTAFAVT